MYLSIYLSIVPICLTFHPFPICIFLPVDLSFHLCFPFYLPVYLLIIAWIYVSVQLFLLISVFLIHLYVSVYLSVYGSDYPLCCPVYLPANEKIWIFFFLPSVFPSVSLIPSSPTRLPSFSPFIPVYLLICLVFLHIHLSQLLYSSTHLFLYLIIYLPVLTAYLSTYFGKVPKRRQRKAWDQRYKNSGQSAFGTIRLHCRWTSVINTFR